ncbi:hypothetical protein ACIQYS_08330 [Psychrobacillus sp. NPDC096426]|uniref:hypothetical protein n=1 Tax=Psychrobacillus sp. NPDC096426 TaxID=3364491 RepID=UPI003818EEE5
MKKQFLLSVLIVPIFLMSTITIAEATPTKVMWGKTELKIGQIGKITVLSTAPTYQMNEGTFKQSPRSLKKGDEYRVYSYKGKDVGYYGLGGGLFVKKSDAFKYETPSKAKLALLKMQELSLKEGITEKTNTTQPSNGTIDEEVELEIPVEDSETTPIYVTEDDYGGILIYK